MVEHETQKLKELDEEHSQELKEWREKLRPRKKVTWKPCLRCCVSMHCCLLLVLYFSVCLRLMTGMDRDAKAVPCLQAQGLMSSECKLGSLWRGR